MAQSKVGSFLIVGLGTFGHQAAAALAEGGARVIAIDQDRDRVDKVAHLCVKAAAVDACDEDALAALGAFDVDVAIVSVGEFFDITVLVTHLLRKRRVAKVVVQVNSQRQAEAIRTVGATHTCFPERDSARTIVSHFISDKTGYERIAIGRDAGIIEVMVPPLAVGKSLRTLELPKRYTVNVVAIKTPPVEEGLSEAITVSPDPDAPLIAGQVLVVLGHHRHLGHFHEVFPQKG